MARSHRLEEALAFCEQRLTALQMVDERFGREGPEESVKQSLQRWAENTYEGLSEHLGATERHKFYMLLRRVDDVTRSLHTDADRLTEAIVDCQTHIVGLTDDLRDGVQVAFAAAATGPGPVGPQGGQPRVDSQTVFLAYGKDVSNAQALERLLETEWKLKPKLLSREAGGGRHLMEALEDEAGRAGYALVIMTPDDHVANEDEEPYRQARPNVMLELGWLYGKLGRSRVCIILKKGTTLPSDVHGIKYVDFTDDVNEKFQEIRAELRRAAVIKDNG